MVLLLAEGGGGGASSSSSSAAAASAASMSASASSSSSGGGDADREPFLAQLPSPGGSRLAALRRVPRELLRRLPLLCALCSVSSGVTWVVKGFFVCVGMMLAGGAGSFALQQMMSPQIEALLKQRAALQKDLDALQLQVETLTSIAASRLETIHLLEKELERQALEAAAATATAHSDAGAAAGRLRDGRRVLPGFTLPTIVYAGLLGAAILALVVYRVYRIVQIEVREHKNALRTRSGSSGSHHHPGHHSHSHASHRHRRDSSLLPSHSLANASPVDAGDDASSSRADASSSSRAGLPTSPRRLESDAPSPQQCYKRSQPPASPDLMHV